MNVSSYIFQSPYSSPIQVGRPDMSAAKEENTNQTGPNIVNATLEKAQNFKETQIQEVKAKVQEAPLLDTYA